MKVYTKKGDSGTTGLIGGTRVPKYNIRIEGYGTVDELNSYIGLLRDKSIEERFTEELIQIQDRLFTMGSWLASDPEKGKMQLPEIHESDILALENSIDWMDEQLEPMKNFVLPGGHETVSFCHIARCVCRRAERLVTHLNVESPINPLILAYLNRLSDYLFVYSRYLTHKLNAKEVAWQPKLK
ncbi:cob(I)yrinic acid a,c-diamide adenosyltransferase [Crocinitomix catalasitica]|uniref:cob(I)yrinic acid a,c-diamide adenosyltransferase n=1 Tax=Crocinitomix catalasitica TaxID=184607 RepID=UPI000481C765|nr:cob(I)yrinic acid a,c-diamide adenosyltransferase [Crocinitomix catalasitica]